MEESVEIVIEKLLHVTKDLVLNVIAPVESVCLLICFFLSI